MTVKGPISDPITNMPIVILREVSGERVLPIWVGVFEANAIALQIENVQTPRPMTHDLLKTVISELGGSVERIVVCSLKDNTFYATLHVLSPSGPRTVDARPSDAIALGVAGDTPIYVEEGVLRQVCEAQES